MNKIIKWLKNSEVVLYLLGLIWIFGSIYFIAYFFQVTGIVGAIVAGIIVYLVSGFIQESIKETQRDKKVPE